MNFEWKKDHILFEHFEENRYGSSNANLVLHRYGLSIYGGCLPVPHSDAPKMQYFTVPLPFLQESSGMAPESSGILRNGTGIELKSSGMRLDHYVYMQIYVYKHLYVNKYNRYNISSFC